MRARTIAVWLATVALLLTGTVAGAAANKDRGASENNTANLSISFSDDCRTVTVDSDKDISNARADFQGDQTHRGDWDYINEDGESLNPPPFVVTFDHPVVIAQAKSAQTVVTEECNGHPPTCEEDPSGEPDTDGDGLRDECDPCPHDDTNTCEEPPTCEEDPSGEPDTDGDGLRDECDPCPDDDTNTCGEPDLRCRANLLAVALGGNALPNLFEANPDSSPCVDEQDGLLVALSPLLGDDGLGLLNEENQVVLAHPDGPESGFILVDALWADTEEDGGTANADSGVLHLIVNDGSGDQIVVEVLTSESTSSCEGGTETSAEVVRIFIGGEEIRIPGEHTVLIAPELFEVIELHLEDAGEDGTDEGPDDTGAQAVDASALAGNVLVGVADSETGCG